MNDIVRDRLPVIHRCAAHGCRTLAFAEHCPAHTTPADDEHQIAVDAALAEVALAEAYWRETRERLAVLEARAGIRRA